jgi:hypothetical protein
MRENRTPLRWVWVMTTATSAACTVSTRTAREPGNVAAESGGVQPARDRLEQVCVVEGDSLRMLAVTRSPTTGDTLVDGVPFRNAHPGTYPPYVAAVHWYVADEPVPFGERTYVRNRPPQVARVEQLRFLGRYRGVPVFRAAEEEMAAPSTIYLPVRPGCVFQPLTALSPG